MSGCGTVCVCVCVCVCAADSDVMISILNANVQMFAVMYPQQIDCILE